MRSTLPVLEHGSVVTVGSFDGIHLGHRRVLDTVVQRAAAERRAGIAVTFEPHPAAVVRPEAAPLRLTTGGERQELLAQSGLDYAVFLEFNREMAHWTPAEFVRRVVLDRCQCRVLVIGPDHHFGRDREGGEALLREVGRAEGFVVEVVPPMELDGEAVSSTRIRRLVAAGKLPEAARCLGRPYAVSGVVVRGAARGRQLGVPTANLSVPEGKQLPPDGVYAVRVEWGGGIAEGMLNQGPRPTFDDGRRLLEAHLFDFEGDLYDRMLRITWVERLREVRKFDSMVALQEQVERDRQAARTALAAASAAKDHNRV
ncbi:MAG: bifunctional riboflavin kinase/FAD synthetase [Gemmatimonadota bacterium]|nr:bifunctional riboflavin kinase/FAD synthetase [Gemmatimonadota bacterium]